MKSLLGTINQIFPFYLTLIVNFPLIIGLFINSDLVSPRLVMINFIWQTLIVILYRVLKSTALYRTVLVVATLFSLIEGLHWIILKGPLSTSSLFVISATNYSESFDFLSIKNGFKPTFIYSIIPFLLFGLEK